MCACVCAHVCIASFISELENPSKVSSETLGLKCSSTYLLQQKMPQAF